jgi:hypothetical protein
VKASPASTRRAVRRSASAPSLARLRARVVAAFDAFGNAVDVATAQQRAKTFYRAAGLPWSRAIT